MMEEQTYSKQELQHIIGKTILIDDQEWRIAEIVNREVSLNLETPDGEILAKKISLAEASHLLRLNEVF